MYHSSGNCIIETASKTLVVGCQTSVIPADGSVTSIDARAFEGCTGVITIVIPNGVTSIGAYAFAECDNLTAIVLPNGVTSIDHDAFYGCARLTEIVIPASVTSPPPSVTPPETEQRAGRQLVRNDPSLGFNVSLLSRDVLATW